MITVDLFKIRFPEFSCLPDEQIQMFVDDSADILNEAQWGTKYDLGLYYYTAHLVETGQRTAAGNKGPIAPVSGKAVDGVSISYAVNQPGEAGDAWLSSTAYGQRYIALRKNLGISAFAI